MRRIGVSVALTAVDLAILFALARGAGLPVLISDAASIIVTSALSWTLHRGITFAGDRNVRWVRSPSAFVIAAAVAGVVDLAITTVASVTLALGAAKALGIVVAGVVRLVAYRGVLGSDVRRHLGQRRDVEPSDGAVRLSVIVPAKDEAGRIAETVRRLRSELDDLEPEVVVVDDGSSDGTAEAAVGAGATVLRHDENRGKGAAVRTGVQAARGRTIAFLDADLAYAPAQLRPLVASIEDGWDVAVGDRFHPDSVVEGRTRLRFLAGRMFNALTATVLLGQYRDTQCGCKAFRADVARSLFGRTKLDRFAFDVEVFHLIERDRFSLVALPVTLHELGGSSVRVVRASLEMMRDLIRVRRWSRLGMYDR